MLVSKRLTEIARILNISPAQAYRAQKSGLIKLSKRKDFSLIIETLHAVQEDPHCLLSANSLECNKEWINLYGGLGVVRKKH